MANVNDDSMEQYLPQDEIRRTIITDMVRKRNVFHKPNADMLACMLRREKRRTKSNSIVPLVLLWKYYEPLKWISCVFEEGSMIMLRYALLAEINPHNKFIYQNIA